MYSLNQILLEKGVFYEDKALFKNQSDVTNHMIAYDKKTGVVNTTEATHRSFFSQIKRGGRRLSGNYKDCLVGTILEQVHASAPTKVSLADAKKLVEEAIEANDFWIYEKDQIEGSIPDFFFMRLEAEEAKVHFILNFQPAELTKSPHAAALTSEMVRNLNLMRSVDAGFDKLYIFYFPSKIVAERFWINLHSSLVSNGLSESEASSSLEKISSDAEQKLRVYISDPSICVYPTVVYDPDEQNRRGFIFYYHTEDRISIAQMSNEALSLWYQHHYLPLITFPKKFGVEQINWNDVANYV